MSRQKSRGGVRNISLTRRLPRALIVVQGCVVNAHIEAWMAFQDVPTVHDLPMS